MFFITVYSPKSGLRFAIAANELSNILPSKAVDVAITAPAPKGLTLEVEEEPEQTPQRHETHVGHDRRHEARLLHPGSDEPAKAIMVSRHCFTKTEGPVSPLTRQSHTPTGSCSL